MYNVFSEYQVKVINLIFVSWDVLRAACGAASAGKYRSVAPLNIDTERHTVDCWLTHSVLAAPSGNLRVRRPQLLPLDRILQKNILFKTIYCIIYKRYEDGEFR